MKYQPRTIDILSFIYTLGYFITLGIAFYQPFPKDNKDTLILLLGILSMIMGKIVEAYFNKDAANSAAVSTIKALNRDPTADDSLPPPAIK